MYSLEELAENCYLVRMGPNHKKYGDPYTATVIMVINGKTAHFKGACGNLREIRYLLNECRDKYGCDVATWERKREDGTVKLLQIDLAV